jgi:S1-C subfamily serine protease
MISDIALLKIDGDKFQYCNLGDSDDVKVGEWAIALGNPRNLISNVQYQPIASAGIISAINADFNLDSQSGKLLDNMIQTDASLNPGNSGGPLIDSNGSVIGINTFTKSDSENLGFAIPINFAKKIANELKLKGAIDRRVSFGLNARQYLYGPDKDQIGLFIDKVDYNDSARNEELFRGDIIVAVEGYKIESLEEIKIVLIKLDARSGDDIELTVLREDSFQDVKMTLGEI